MRFVYSRCLFRYWLHSEFECASIHEISLIHEIRWEGLHYRKPQLTIAIEGFRKTLETVVYRHIKAKSVVTVSQYITSANQLDW